MKKVATTALAALILNASASPASAWWDYAKWGMSEQQVAAASKGQAQVCAQNERGPCGRLMDPVTRETVAVPRLYIESITIAGEPASVAFFFDGAKKLNWTMIRFERANYRVMTDTLSGIYGAPVQQQGGTFANSTWRDTAKGTLIKAVNMAGNGVRVEYQPIKSGL